MTNKFPFLFFALALLFGLGLAAQTDGHSAGRVVVANRNSGDLSVIDAATNQLVGTHALPPGANPPQPMYVVYGWFGRRVFVGDRGNDRVVVFRAHDFSVETTIAAGAGVFHMWSDIFGRQLWVNNDIDNTASVIDMWSLQNTGTVAMPADLVAAGGKPHDVVVDAWGRSAFVSMVGVAGANDYVVKFSTRSGQETARAAVGKDPHLSLTWRNNHLYAPAQGANTVHVVDRDDLSPVTDIPVPAAHGAAMTRLGRYFYTTNIAGGGPAALYTIDTRANALVGPPTDAPLPTPHNLVVAPRNGRIFVTHSGATANQVSVYDTGWRNPLPVFVTTVTVGTNPFGLGFVP